MKYQVQITPTAQKMLKSITDARIRGKIIERIEGLTTDPDKQGKPLIGPLSHYRSLRAAGQRYRIIYQIDGKKVIVTIVAIGIRKEGDRNDIYKLAQKLVRLGLLGKKE